MSVSTTEPGTDDEGQIEAWLTEEGSKTRLEERWEELTRTNQQMEIG